MILKLVLITGLLGTAGCMAGHGGGCGGGEHPAAAPAPSQAGIVYRCAHDGGERATPGPCPKCGMTLEERHRVSTR